jgi:hypothetical protein
MRRAWYKSVMDHPRWRDLLSATLWTGLAVTRCKHTHNRHNYILQKAKAVPLHAMKALWGRGCIDLNSFLTWTLDGCEWSASRKSWFYLDKSESYTKCEISSETSVDNYFTRQYIPEDNSEHHTQNVTELRGLVANTPAKFSDGVGFDFRLCDRQSWLKFSVVYLSPSRQRSG